jgi:hypothetical protein
VSMTNVGHGGPTLRAACGGFRRGGVASNLRGMFPGRYLGSLLRRCTARGLSVPLRFYYRLTPVRASSMSEHLSSRTCRRPSPGDDSPRPGLANLTAAIGVCVLLVGVPAPRGARAGDDRAPAASTKPAAQTSGKEPAKEAANAPAKTVAKEAAEEAKQAELLKTDSDAPYVHRLTLYDESGAAISPKSANAPPYSPRTTCGKCHPYAQIAQGWHFNEPDPNVAIGRPGEPWIYLDKQTGTVLPLSDRGWSGTFKPGEIGLTNWDMVLRFGSHTPGGGYGESTKEQRGKPPMSLRWGISGPREVDCMYCHAANQQHDPAEAARQIEAQNFKWAPTVAYGLAAVRGEARKVPDDFDPEMPPSPDRPEASGPKLVYDKTRFDADDRVLFEITKQPSAERCYFCHTTRLVGTNAPADLVRPRDVHVAAGLACVDCHGNTLDHLTARGYGDEWNVRKDKMRAAFSCEGCHLGPDGARADADDEEEHADLRERPRVDAEKLPREVALGGRYGAPRPEHKGLPPLHFDKLTCTACHSGPWPGDHTVRVQTALAHKLGLTSRERRDTDPPLIVEPVFLKQADGRVAPMRMIWPAYFGVLHQDGGVKPLAPEYVKKVAGNALPKAAKGKEAAPPTSAPSEDVLTKVLTKLGELKDLGGEPVWVENGQVLVLNQGKLASRSEPRSPASDDAYTTWPLAHDVRPASQALGVGGCTDCHGAAAPLYFGHVLPPVDGTAGESPNRSLPDTATMLQYRGDDAKLAKLWALGFTTRPLFKWFTVVCLGLVTLLVLQYIVTVLTNSGTAVPVAADAAASGARAMRLSGLETLCHLCLIVSTLVLGATAHVPKLSGGEMEGYMLLAHMLAAPLFIVGLTGTALLWTRWPRGRLRASVPGLVARLQRWSFWLTVSTGIVVTASVLLAMWPLFGTTGQRELASLHEDSSLVFVVLIVMHTLVSLYARFGQRAEAKRV